MSDGELSDWLDAAVEAAHLGAAELNSWRHRFKVREKAPADLVTEADLASQRVIRAFLAGRFPAHGFLGEEDGPNQPRPGPDAPPTWIVDPLDGTTNYVHDVPQYCVSVGVQAAGDPVVGVVFDPRGQELFTAAKGQGAFLNGERLSVSATAELGEALLSCGFPADLRGQEQQLEWWRLFSLRARSLRRTGSTALNMAYVAAGRFDGYWGFANNPWDVAGGIVLIREAGGTVTGADGRRVDAFAPDVLASNGPLHPALLASLREGPEYT